MKSGTEAREAFEQALFAIKNGLFTTALALMIDNPPSDQRIIEKRIADAMANDANSAERQF